MTGTHEITKNERVNGHDWTGGVQACKNCGMTRATWQESWQTCIDPKPAPAGVDDTAAERKRCLEIVGQEIASMRAGRGLNVEPIDLLCDVYRDIEGGVYAPTLPAGFSLRPAAVGDPAPPGVLE